MKKVWVVSIILTFTFLTTDAMAQQKISGYGGLWDWQGTYTTTNEKQKIREELDRLQEKFCAVSLSVEQVIAMDTLTPLQQYERLQRLQEEYALLSDQWNEQVNLYNACK